MFLWAQFLQEVIYAWTTVVGFANSTFATSLLTAGFGAGIGAPTAKKIADRGKLRDELMKEIRSVNVAINLAFLTSNMFLTLKEQHVRRMKRDYDAKRAEFEQTLIDGGRFELPADFEGLAPVSTPVEHLQTMVFDKLSSRAGRPIVLVPMLAQVVQATNSIIAERNRLIEEFRTNRRPGDNGQLLAFYFGIRDAHGNIDNRFGNTIDHLYRHTDDCIAFAHMLIKDLGTHGDELKKRFDSRFRNKAPMIHKPLFTKAEQRGLMPDPGQYADWDAMFIATKSKPSLVKRLQRRLVSPLVFRYRLIWQRMRSTSKTEAATEALSVAA